MTYVIVRFTGQSENTTKEFQTPYNALRFMYAMRNNGHLILGYYADDPLDTDWLNKRFRL